MVKPDVAAFASNNSQADVTSIPDLIRVVDLLNDQLLRMNGNTMADTKSAKAENDNDTKQQISQSTESMKSDMAWLAGDTDDSTSALNLAKLYGFESNSAPKRKTTIALRAKPETVSLTSNTKEVKKQEEEEEQKAQADTMSEPPQAGSDSTMSMLSHSPRVTKTNQAEKKDNTSIFHLLPSTSSLLPASQDSIRRQDSSPKYSLRRRATDTSKNEAEVYVLDLTSEAELDDENSGYRKRKHEEHPKSVADQDGSVEEYSFHPADRPMRDTIQDSRSRKRRRTPSPRTPPNQMIVCRTPRAPKRRK
ncbi:hypothetical protein PMZ80_003525 [Knufia obscura]|uniref:Shugoshin C-terminal domain-containing protein n=1 Tax=Knufia obscura TaxID=1635080 RepID=A0ABR0RW27_9EURO|nr:hypothetical protein PMZ80_003525 [Knufia obscura]